jgi:hypothetical protein
MSIALYRDVHVEQAITEALRARGVDVLTAQEDGTRRLADPRLLDRATTLGRVLFTRDQDFLGEAHQRQVTAQPFMRLLKKSSGSWFLRFFHTAYCGRKIWAQYAVATFLQK